jgi:hypothetical protein
MRSSNGNTASGGPPNADIPVPLVPYKYDLPRHLRILEWQITVQQEKIDTLEAAKHDTINKIKEHILTSTPDYAGLKGTRETLASFRPLVDNLATLQKNGHGMEGLEQELEVLRGVTDGIGTVSPTTDVGERIERLNKLVLESSAVAMGVERERLRRIVTEKERVEREIEKQRKDQVQKS